MVLKRKRSDSEISTTNSIFLSSLSSSNFMNPESSNAFQFQTSCLFSSRTRKRHRDDRPEESAVHQHTLNILYAAQQNTQSQNQSSPSQSHVESMTLYSQAPVASLPTSTRSSGHQSSLHSFWALPSVRSSSPSSVNSASSTDTPNTAAHVSYFQSTNCEDCDASLVPEDDGDAMDVDMLMDIDTVGGANHACSECGKIVCHSCAVSNLGAERKCLFCAGKKKCGGVLPTMFRSVHKC